MITSTFQTLWESIHHRVGLALLIISGALGLGHVAAIRVTSSPKRLIVPFVTGRAPAMRLKSVVFPAPLGPISARRSPG